jgi:prepilin signal peptidase PulO-like enzyme (type II secretory pathway)
MTLALLFVAGVFVGSFLNVAIERLRWNQGLTSPWLPDPKRKLAATWLDRIPVIGWWPWRRAEKLYGRGFWVRPIFVELLTGSLFAGLYAWEVQQRQLLPLPFQFVPALPRDVWPAELSFSLHVTFQSHLILVVLMVAATFIDIDDQVIPDSITLPGTLAGLFLAAVVPWSLLPDTVFVVGGGPRVVDFLRLTSPEVWMPRFNGAPNRFSLWVGLGCYWGWCFALLPRHLRLRHGWKRAGQIFCARIVREPITWLMLLIGLVGSAAIAFVWWIGGVHWIGLITSLVGMAGGGAIVWGVRVVSSVALGKEAMGFGDVTLMAMIGAFLGWQAAIIVFFLSPPYALLAGVATWLLRRENRIPFGPFLCLGALTTILLWRDVWPFAADRAFRPIWLMPALLTICSVPMAAMLLGWRMLKYWLAGDDVD